MNDAQVAELLDSRGAWMALTTIAADGFPHTVPLGHFRLDGDIYLGCRRHTQKVRNIERNPHVSLMVEPGRASGRVQGVMIQGLATVIDDDTERLRLTQAAARRRGDVEPQEVKPGGCYIRVHPHKIITWDYSH